jgi:hypothetical protein
LLERKLLPEALMRTLSAHGRVVVLGCCVAVWTVLAACSVEDENPPTSRNRGTNTGADGSTGTGADGTAPSGAPLCGKYGGLDGVKGIAAAIVAAAKADCRISPVVSNAEAERGTHFKECFDQFVGGGFQCPGVSFSLGQTKDSEGDPCNSQMPGVRFTDRDFNAFSENVKKGLESKGLTADEIRAIAPVFEGARLKLVNDPSKTKHAQCAPSCQQGGDACIRIIDGGNDVQNPPVIEAGPDAADEDADAG